MAENRGGRRQGTPGKAYSNRTDLNQPVMSAPSTSYGSRVASERSQAAAPLPQSPGVPPGIAGLMAPAGGTEPPAPGLFRGTERPGEPVQQGLGAGPAPDDYDLLRALKEQYPTAGMAELFQAMGYG